jgi:peptidoglycan endopeptidase LytF
MTRRDTIISAALINAGLLVVLFVCALGIDDGSQVNAQTVEMTPAVHTSAPAQVLIELSSIEKTSTSQEIALDQPVAAVQEIPVSRSSSQVVQIEVQKGDRVDKIASRYGMDVEQLLQLNNLQTTQLVVGQKLNVISSNSNKIALSEASSESSKTVAKEVSKVAVESSKPAKEAVKKEPKKEPVKVVAAQAPIAKPLSKTAPSADETVQYHYVQRGESPWVIAKKYGISVEKLLKLNNLDEATARRLREGDRLRVR